ncbi:alpha/beta hydrolase-fold protein [Anaerostipes sp.]|uniref:alpha/beta hydrolase-fold protein n=1 Tax=Anaerostipes sp. TaxID=1872530 RepID=UPI0025C1D32E|nr:alpha/beta hydrolase-fold protein [Anaerostipes sp.]MBS7009012.1 hypothetical protein [Anaerostipes sp.]
MAFILCDFYSRSLGKDTDIFMVFPEYRRIAEEKIKLCTLMHGQGQDASFWIRRTKIEQIAEEQNMAVIMPEAAGSFFAQMPNEKNFRRYIQEELPEFLDCTFPFLSKNPKDHMIAGIGENCSGNIQDIVEKGCSYYGRGDCLSSSFTDEDLRDLVSGWQQRSCAEGNL